MDIKNILQNTAEEIAGVGTDIIDFAVNGANFVYQKVSNKTLNKTPFSAKVWVNDITSDHLNFKAFHNIPTTKELKDPNKAKNYVLKAVRNNDNELLQITFSHSLQNPQSANTVIQTVKEDFKNRINATLKGRSNAQDNIIAVREYKLLKSLIQSNPQIKPQLQEIVKFEENLNNNEKVKSNPQLKAIKHTIEHYEKVNDFIDIANAVSVLTFGAGKGLKIVAKTPIAKTVANAIIGASASTPLVGGLYQAKENQESITHTISPLDLTIGGDVVKSVKEIPKTAKTIPVYDMKEKLKSKDFKPIDFLLEHYSKNNKLNKTEIESFKADVINAKVVENKSLKDKIIHSLNTFSGTISKNVGERANVILNKVLSIKNSEEEILKQDRAITEAFFDYEPVKRYITENFTKDGKIVIDDVEKLENDLMKMAENDNLIANYLTYHRQKNLLSELNKAIEHNNSEVVIGRYKSDVISVDENNRIQPPIENLLIDLKKNSLQDILDIVEEEFKKGNVITIGYKTKEGKLITKTLKPVDIPTVGDYRVLKGSFQVLKDNEIKEIEDSIIIPASRTHEVNNVLKEYAKTKGYDDIKINNALYYKPSKNILNLKLENTAKVVLDVENKLISNGKIDNKDFENLVKTAYDNGFLHKAVETDKGRIDIGVDYYLKLNHFDVLNAIKHNITQHMKAVVSRDKELEDVTEHYVLDKDSNTVKLLNTRLQQLEEFSKHYNTNTLNKEITELKDLLNKFKSSDEVGYKAFESLHSVLDNIATKMDTTSELLKELKDVGFNTFNSYENFKNFATLKHLTPTLSNLKSIPALHEFLETLENIEKLNPNGLNETQKLVKNFLELTLGKNNTLSVKFQRAFGNLLTLLNPAVSLGNFVATFQTLHLLIPSLDITKISEVGSAWNKEMKKLIYSEGIYKYNFLNPTTAFTEGIIKAHLLANFKNNETFEKAIEDYCRNLGITSTEFINEMKAFYKDRKEEFAEDLVNFISGLDGRVLQTFAVKGAKIGENIMPWYKFVASPFSTAIQIIKNWKDAPEYITKHGIGKTIGKAVGFSTFSAIALGSQAVPFLAPAETGYTLISQFGNLIANILGEEDIFTDKNFSQLVLKELDYRYLKTGLLDPNEKVNFYNSFGTALLQAIAGAEAVGWDTNPFVHYLRVGLDIISKLGSSGIISPTAGSYVADIPAPSLSLIQNIVKKTMYADDDKSKATATLLALAQSIPLTNNIYKEIAGRVLVKGIGATGKDEIWQPSISEELLSKDGQGMLGIAHLVGFIALHGDTIFNGGMMQKAYQVMRYELATDEEKKELFSPVKNPAGVERYIGLNFKDIKVFTDNEPDEIIATLRYIPENRLQDVKDRAVNLMTKNYKEMVKILKKEEYTDRDVKELKHRFSAIQNFLIVSDYMNWYDDKKLEDLKALHNQLYKVLKSKQIDIDYKDIIRIKRKLREMS